MNRLFLQRFKPVAFGQPVRLSGWGLAHAVAPIYGWFTEGFDTADLIDTKALLELL